MAAEALMRCPLQSPTGGRAGRRGPPAAVYLPRPQWVGLQVGCGWISHRSRHESLTETHDCRTYCGKCST
jgi:hypothetical protein